MTNSRQKCKNSCNKSNYAATECKSIGSGFVSLSPMAEQYMLKSKLKWANDAHSLFLRNLINNSFYGHFSLSYTILALQQKCKAL